MKINNAAIYVSKPAVEELLKINWPVKCAWQIALLAGELSRSLNAIEDFKNRLVRKYGVVKDGQLSISPKIKNDKDAEEDNPNWLEFVAKMNELLNESVEIDFEIIELPQQANGLDLQIKPEVLLALLDFVTVADTKESS